MNTNRWKKNCIDISNWMKQEIESFLRNYEILTLNVHTELFVRNTKAQILNSINIKYNDPSAGKSIIVNYDSDDVVYSDSNNKKIINYIKDLECRAFLKFGPEATSQQNAKPELKDPTPIKQSYQKTSNTKNVTLRLFVTATPDQIKLGFTNPQFIILWTGTSNLTTNGFKFENVEIENIESIGILKMKFKLLDWSNLIDVIINFTVADDVTRLDIDFKNVPILAEDGIKLQWKHRIIGMICKIFNCCIKSE